MPDSSSSASTRRAASPAQPRDHLTLTGWVPDAAYIDHANVVVAPLRLGGGMRVKVLEALARGKAVVGTSVALAGLPVADIGAAVCADDDNEFVDAVAELLLDETRRVEMAHRAREWAVVELAWSLAITRFDAVYDSIAQPRGRDVPKLADLAR